MENALNCEENNLYTEEINNTIVLRYKLAYFSKNYFEQPIFKKWLEEEIKKNEKEDKKKRLFKCRNCNCFIYDIDYINNIKCCEKPYFQYICRLCGSVFYGHSYCCLKKALKSDFGEYLLDGYYTCNTNNTDGLIECAKAFPLVFHIAFPATIFCALFLHRRGSNFSDVDSCFESRLTTLSNVAKIIMYLLIFLYAILFFLPLSFAHLIYLIIFFNGYKTKYDK